MKVQKLFEFYRYRQQLAAGSSGARGRVSEAVEVEFSAV